MKDLKKTTLAKGKFAEYYTQTTFMAMYTAFDIDKVKLSFAKIGSHGKGCDIYVDTDYFDILCDDILSGELWDKIINSKKDHSGYYPSIWEYSTGKKASKKVFIARGMKQPIVITGYDAETKERVMVTVMKYSELRIMAKWWRRISAPYYQKLAAVGYEAKDSYSPTK